MGWRQKRRERRRKKRVPWEELQDLLSLDPRQFEQAVAAIIRELGGRRVRVMGGSRSSDEHRPRRRWRRLPQRRPPNRKWHSSSSPWPQTRMVTRITIPMPAEKSGAT